MRSSAARLRLSARGCAGRRRVGGDGAGCRYPIRATSRGPGDVLLPGAPLAQGYGVVFLFGKRTPRCGSHGATEPRSGCCGRALPQASSSGGRVTPRRAGPRPQRTYGAAPTAREAPASSGFVPAITSFGAVSGGEGRRVQRRPHGSFAAARLSLQPQGVSSGLCHSGDNSDPLKGATRSLRDRPLVRTSRSPGRELRYSVPRAPRER